MIDLHIHSNYSDGNNSIDQIVEKCVRNNINTIAITDHNSILGLSELQEKNIDFINGIEFYPKRYDTNGFHLLAYDFNPNEEFHNLLQELEKKRYDSMLLKIDAVKEKFNIDIDIDSLPQEWLSNFTLYNYLLENHSNALATQVIKYLNDNGFKVDKKIDYLRLIKVILSSDGIPVLAHPKSIKCNNFDLFITDLIDNGLMGIEVYHSSHTKDDVKRFLDISKKYDLLTSGGSDFHGYGKKDALGNDIEIGKIFLGSPLEEDDLSIIKYVKRRK